MKSFQHFFFIGIAGTGMSAIAQYLSGIGKKVSGSDRQFSISQKLEIQIQFEKMGINCFSQDASGISDDVDVVIVSTAIEESNIEYLAAVKKNIPIMKRSEILAEISKTKRTIAVGGTSGKSTTTAMIFHILQSNNYEPSLITGAGLTELQQKGLPGNAWVGKGDWLVIEADESDGSIVNYFPEIALVLNIDRDHKEFDELIDLFKTFKKNTSKTFIVNNDHPITQHLSVHPSQNFGLSQNAGIVGSDFNQVLFKIFFNVNNIPCEIPVIGKHNMENALAAIAAAKSAGISIHNSIASLKNYIGIYRRTQLIGEKQGCFVVDDFAHNPAEVSAAIKACQQIGKRVLAWFQPHGYGPLKFMHLELSEKVSEILRKDDIFFLSEVYYAGGTVNKDIQSDIVTDAINKKGKYSVYIQNRKVLITEIQKIKKEGDVILLMGARDITLSNFAKEMYLSL